MKVSVVIPVYNEEKTIENPLKSLKEQLDPPDEVILVDNNCTDRSMEIAKKYNVTIIKQPKQGKTFALYKGYDSAKYEVIARTDADTILPPTWIQQIRKDFEENKIDGLFGDFLASDLPINVRWFSRLNVYFHRIWLGHYSFVGPNMAFTKKIWEKITDKVCQDDIHSHDDVDVAMHIHMEGGVIMYDRKLYVYTSARRAIHNPYSFFVEYLHRTLEMKRKHHYI